jgi:hypothetical protein
LVLGFGLRLQAEKVFDVDLQRLGELQGDGCVGDVGASLDGVDGLTAHSDLAR